MKTAMQELIDELKLIEAYPMSPLVLRMAEDLLEKEKEQIDLETYLRIKLDEKDAKQLYDISTDDVRGWIDWYNEAEIKSFPPTHHFLTNQNELPKNYINNVEVKSDNNNSVMTNGEWNLKANYTNK